MNMDFVAAGVPDGNRIEHEREMASQHAKTALATPGRGTRLGNLRVSAAAEHDPKDTQLVRAQASLRRAGRAPLRCQHARAWAGHFIGRL